MSKKQDFIRSQQNRDKHPEAEVEGSAASLEQEGARTANKGVAEQDRQAAHSPKLSNDHNKVGNTHPTQKNEGRRTPESRHDRQVNAGTMNQVEARTGGKGGGRGSRGGNTGGAG